MKALRDSGVYWCIMKHYCNHITFGGDMLIISVDKIISKTNCRFVLARIFQNCCIGYLLQKIYVKNINQLVKVSTLGS